jgi:hypothetical protein
MIKSILLTVIMLIYPILSLLEIIFMKVMILTFSNDYSGFAFMHAVLIICNALLISAYIEFKRIGII